MSALRAASSVLSDAERDSRESFPTPDAPLSGRRRFLCASEIRHRGPHDTVASAGFWFSDSQNCNSNGASNTITLSSGCAHRA
jgi:hypothetical protein